MSKIIEILRNCLQNLGVLRPKDAPQADLEPVETQTEPKIGKIGHEPLLALENGNLIMVVDHYFENIPSWVEWDSERKVITITHMNGDHDEAAIDLKEEYYESLKMAQKLLLVSNENASNDNERIMQTVSFLSR
ncbi:MAG: hypothetical protein AB8B83_04620 [Bdellovibrionales bacterium]